MHSKTTGHAPASQSNMRPHTFVRTVFNQADTACPPDALDASQPVPPLDLPSPITVRPSPAAHDEHAEQSSLLPACHCHGRIVLACALLGLSSVLISRNISLLLPALISTWPTGTTARGAREYGPFGGMAQVLEMGDAYQTRPGNLGIDGTPFNSGRVFSGVATRFDEGGDYTAKSAGKGRLRNKACTLAVAALIKNENHGLVEWMEHYLGEGACHFYFLNNDRAGSPKHQTFLRTIRPYERRGLVTHFHAPPNPKLTTPQAFSWIMQMRVFASTVHAAARADNITEWMVVVDMDEYMYANSWNTTLAQYLETDVPDDIDQICMPERTFGTSGFKWQPSCIVPFFSQRGRFNGGRTIGGKCVVRVDATPWFGVHMHTTTNRPNQTNSLPIVDGVMKRTFASIRGSYSIPMAGWHTRERDLPEWPIAFNHYQSQSFEQYFRKRHGPGPRTRGQVRRVDVDHVTDDFLLRKMHWRRPGVGECTAALTPPAYADDPFNGTAFEAWYAEQFNEPSSPAK